MRKHRESASCQQSVPTANTYKPEIPNKDCSLQGQNICMQCWESNGEKSGMVMGLQPDAKSGAITQKSAAYAQLSKTVDGI
mmetsp:Transcript_49213/g.77819  ORF Transcript_49213/g.77819 Transcript_49213/m.77819 type:complete len:81 (-) Transcript_49213:609-851(-)